MRTRKYVVYFTSDVEGDKYAILRAQNAHTHVNKLYELRTDNSGFGVTLPDPHDITDWDLDDPIDGIDKVSMWGSASRHFRPIMGPMHETYPQDGWWSPPLLPDPFLLS